MSGVSSSIEKVAKAIAALDAIVAKTPVERVDIADVRSNLQSALEKLEALRSYQEANDTDYEQLWDTRKREIQEYEAARDAWIRTEIFAQLLKSVVN